MGVERSERKMSESRAQARHAEEQMREPVRIYLRFLLAYSLPAGRVLRGLNRVIAFVHSSQSPYAKACLVAYSLGVNPAALVTHDRKVTPRLNISQH